MPAAGFCKLSVQQRAEIVSAYTSTAISTPKLAEQYGVSTSLIRGVLVKAGVDTSMKTRVALQYAAGARPTRAGAKWSEEARAKFSAARKGQRTSLGYRFTPDQRAKLSEVQRARFQRGLGAAEALRRAGAAAAEANRLDPAERAARAQSRNLAKRMLHRLLKRQNKRKDARIAEILGYTADELRRHIEAQFDETMAWDRPGSFHLDHIVPVRVFVDHGITDPATVNALANLRPLSPDANRRKTDKFDGDFNAALAAILDSIGRAALQIAA